MSDSVQERIGFLASHWQDAMGWKAIPFWCVVAAERFFAHRSTPDQLAMLACGILLSLLWSRALSPFVDSRIGILRRPVQSATAGMGRRWLWAMLFVLPPLFAVQWSMDRLLHGCATVEPVGWLERSLAGFLCSWMGINAFQVADRSNPWSRRAWYPAGMLASMVAIEATGRAISYAQGAFLLGTVQCILAVADFALLLRFAQPAAEVRYAEK